MQQQTEVAVLGGGCFWCLEAVYVEVRGVTRVESGYTGGSVPNPTYEQVCAGETGHAEVVRLEFDPAVISLPRHPGNLFHHPRSHHPEPPGQRCRHAVSFRHLLPVGRSRRRPRARCIAEMANVWDAPIVTELAPARPYYKAEDYHQNYFAQHPLQGYCAFVVAPKVEKFRAMYAERLK